MYLTLQHLLSWSPDNPLPFPDLPFYPGELLHAVMSTTDDLNVFSLTDFDDLFNGMRELDISMGPNMMPSSLLNMSQYTVFTNLFFNLDVQVQVQFWLPSAGMSTGTLFDPQPQLAPVHGIHQHPLLRPQHAAMLPNDDSLFQSINTLLRENRSHRGLRLLFKTHQIPVLTDDFNPTLVPDEVH